MSIALKTLKVNLKISLLVIGILASFLGYNFYLKDTTSDWPVYRNEKYGFEIKYPKGWNYSESYDEPDLTRISPEFKTTYIIFSQRGPFTSNEKEKINYNTLEVFEGEFKDIANSFLISEKDPYYTNLGKIKINNLETIKYIPQDWNAGGRNTLYFFYKKGFTYVFSTYGIFDAEMLRSFAFIK